MPERTSVVIGRTVDFAGLFSVAEVTHLVDEFFSKRGYGRSVESNAETVKPKGKFIKVKIRYKRFINDYAYYDILIRQQYEDITQVEIVRNGRKQKINKGKALIRVDAHVITDYARSWEINPTMYFLRILATKFFFRNIHNKWKANVSKDVGDFCAELGSYFNLLKMSE